MIRYALVCQACEHGFEAWFGSSAAYETQVKRALVECPACESREIAKQIMAPAVKGSAKSPEEAAFDEFRAAARSHIAENFDYVGEDFASAARAMYYGETPHRQIWGETTPEESEALKEEGVPAAPLPPGFAPPKPKARKRSRPAH